MQIFSYVKCNPFFQVWLEDPVKAAQIASRERQSPIQIHFCLDCGLLPPRGGFCSSLNSNGAAFLFGIACHFPSWPWPYQVCPTDGYQDKNINLPGFGNIDWAEEGSNFQLLYAQTYVTDDIRVRFYCLWVVLLCLEPCKKMWLRKEWYKWEWNKTCACIHTCMCTF